MDRARGMPTIKVSEIATGVPQVGSVLMAMRVMSSPERTKGEKISEMAVFSLVRCKCTPKYPKVFINNSFWHMPDISS